MAFSIWRRNQLWPAISRNQRGVSSSAFNGGWLGGEMAANLALKRSIQHHRV
jgi:hypothetical protein